MSQPDPIRVRAEALYEELGGDLCICQRADVPHWCEKCQQRISLIETAFNRSWYASPPADADRTTGISIIAAERQRQIEREGWTPEHDDEHRDGEMAVSAARYALEDAGAPWPEPPAVHDAKTALREAWQWASCDWKPKDPIRNLARAGALIAAEIDRRLRVREAADALAISDQDSILDGREARQEMTRAPLTQQGAATTDEDARPAVGNVAKSQLDPSGAAASSALPSSISPAARSREGAQDWIQQRVTAEDIEGAKRIQLIAQLQQRARFLREALPHSPDFGDDRIINKSSIEAVAELLLQAAAALSRPSSSERRRDDDDLSRSPSPDVPSAIGSPRSPQPNGSKQ